MPPPRRVPVRRPARARRPPGVDASTSSAASTLTIVSRRHQHVPALPVPELGGDPVRIGQPAQLRDSSSVTGEGCGRGAVHRRLCATRGLRRAEGWRRMSAIDSALPRRNPRLLDVDQLTAVDRRRVDRHRDRRVHRHAGPAAGKATARRVLPSTRCSPHGTEGCNYLLAVDVEMNTVPGYAISSWEGGYGDMLFVPDLSTIRLLPHLPGTALLQCDLAWLDGKPVEQSPRRILQRQVARAADAGYVALAGTELEFIVFDDTYEQAWDAELPRPHPGQPVQRRLLDPRHDAGGAVAAGHPQQHARRRHGGGVGQGRVQPRPARDRLPLRGCAHHGRQSRRLPQQPPRRSPSCTGDR